MTGMAEYPDSFSVVVSEEGHVYAFGSNGHGQLGSNDNVDRLTPTRIHGLQAPARQVAWGFSHTGIVTDAGDLLMCGKGDSGQLGLGDGQGRTTPTLIPRQRFDDQAVLMVACGDKHTAVVTEGGGVYTFGEGNDGRLGHGHDGGWGTDLLEPRRVPAAEFNGERIVMVAAGGCHTVALSEAGHVFTWGFGDYGQLGHNNHNELWSPQQVDPELFGGDRVVFVAAGSFYTVAVTSEGGFYSWGSGCWGQLGLGNQQDRTTPTLVGVEAFGGSPVVMAACSTGNRHTLVVTRDGGLYASGAGYECNMEYEYRFRRVGLQEFGGERVVLAMARSTHFLVVTENGSLWTWGSLRTRNNLPALGHGDNAQRPVPSRVTAGGLDNVKIGRFRMLPDENTLAFAMCRHPRLGSASRFQDLTEESVMQIAGLTVSRPPGSADQYEPIKRLLGGHGVPRENWPF